MRYGLLGKKLIHSFSKEVHNRLGNNEYELIELSENELEFFLKKKEFSALNVTIPYKETVMPYLDYIDVNAIEIGAVNTVVNRNGKLYGYNTDFFGMKSLIEKSGVSATNKSALILGTGGTSKTAKAVLKSLGVKTILKVSRTKSEDTITYDEAIKSYNNFEIIINTTPVGMYPLTDSIPINLDTFNNLELVIDAVYNPINTKLVLSAQKRGIKAFGGLYMLVCQAVKADGYFFEKKCDTAVLEKIYNEILSSKINIVLTGMPASGKSTIGKKLAEITGRELIDTDDLIIKKVGISISEIFEKCGEEYFRKIESEVIAEASLKNGVIISTGGGAVLRSDNILNLKKNGEIFFLNRPLEDLIPTSDRPLANSRESIIKRYNERIDIYNSTADFVVKVITPDITANEILKYFKEGLNQ